MDPRLKSLQEWVNNTKEWWWTDKNFNTIPDNTDPKKRSYDDIAELINKDKDENEQEQYYPLVQSGGKPRQRYTEFIKERMAEYRMSEPTLATKERFRKAVAAWNTQKTEMSATVASKPTQKRDHIEFMAMFNKIKALVKSD
jgi:hypothetical protein